MYKRQDIPVYGKTGLGAAENIVVDAWFTGFAETIDGNKYFCVYLGQSDEQETSSAIAKQIACLLYTSFITPYQILPITIFTFLMLHNTLDFMEVNSTHGTD